MEDMLVTIDMDARNLQVYNGHDGKLITSHRLESDPRDVCLISENEVAVCLLHGTVVILSLKSIDDVNLVKTLKTGFYCYSLAKWKSDKLIVSGVKDGMLCWGILSIRDGRMDSTHDICTGYDTRMAVKDNTVYISCGTLDSINKGIYIYDILKPKTKKFLYQHQELKIPWSIMADRDYVYVCDKYSNRIHQLTDSGQLVTIHRVSSSLYGIFYDDQQRLLYTASHGSNVITVYKMESLHQPVVPIEILKMDDRSIQLFEEALKDGKETVHSIRIMVVGHMGVGKTTLVKRLLGEKVNISERHSTEGIDVYVNCCDVSLSTHEWIRRTKDSEQDYKLQRLVKVLSQNYQTGGREVDSELDASSNQRETTDGNPLSHVADDTKNTEVPYRHSQQQNIGKNLSSTASLQNESSSTVVQGSLTQSETNTIPGSELGENVATENYKMDPLREMLKLLQQNPNKAKQDISKHAHLTVLDFAGQYAFYTTHQMFLTRRAIYLLVSDASREVIDLVEDDCFFDSEGILKCKVHDLHQVWMNSIHSCALPDKENLNSANSHTSSYRVIPPPVILVGTHIDQIPQNLPTMEGNYGGQNVMPGFSGSSNTGTRSPIHYDVQAKRKRQSMSRMIVSSDGNNPDPSKRLKYDVQAQQNYNRERGQIYLKKIRSSLRNKPTRVHLVDEDFAIDNTILDSKLEELKKKIVAVASQQPYWGEQIPTRWFLLEQQLMRLRDSGVKVVSHSTVEKLNKEGTVRIEESEELDLFLRYLHDTGTIIYFSKIEVLRDNILLDPKWMIDALKLLINAQPNLPNSPADNDTESNSPADNDTESNSPADNDTESNSPADKNTESNSPADNDTESNSPADKNTESNSPADNDTESNSPADNNTESNSPADNNTESNSPADNDTESNSPADNDTESNSPADNDTESNSPADNNTESNSPADNDTESNSPADNDTESNSPADKNTESNSPAASAAHSDITRKWSDFKEKGILTVELVDAIWTKENHPELHEHKEHILRIMEQLNILAKPLSFNEMGEKPKVEDYFLTPCMLRQGSPKEVISPKKDPRMVRTPDMRCIFTGKYLPPPIFHRLLAACVARWPVAKKKETSENLIFCGCGVFDLDLFHRLTVYIKNYVVFARITRMEIDEVKSPDTKLCSRVRRFITLNLSKITSYLGPNLQYELLAAYQTWLADEGHDPDAPITREHMNHARLCVVLLTVCRNAMRDILSTQVPSPHTDIHQAILANKVKLTSRQGRPLLNSDQIQLVFPDPQGKTTGKVDQFDLSLLYILIRNISTVPAPVTGWGYEPQDQPRDNSLGASVERIRSYRNHIIGHSMDGKMSQHDFDDYWNKIDAVLDDIELKLGKQGYRAQLEKQKTQVISVYEAC